MDHEEAKELLSEYLEGELSADRQHELNEHLQACESCRAELETLRATLHTLGGMHRVPPPSDFVSKVQQRIRRRSRGRFFAEEKLLTRVPFEWISFVIILIMMAMYIFTILGQVSVQAPRRTGQDSGAIQPGQGEVRPDAPAPGQGQ